ALEAGAEDFLADPEGYEIITDPNQFETVLQTIEGAAIPTMSATVTFLPELLSPVSVDSVPAIQKLIDMLDDHDDVTNLHTNVEFPQ
ncbi:MAG: YebC/PmpR family DNA-binding transcriptional regulator, partial [Limisphaerales bacterium]